MKKSLILCLIAVGALLVSGCGEQTVDFGCDEGEKICNKDNNVESCVVCESDGTHTYWVKKTCVMGINSEGNKCNEEVCKYGVDEINKGCLNPAFCVNGWNNDGSCKAVDNCAVKNDNGDNVNEEDGSCKKMEGCLIGNEQDGSCKKVEGCVLGNEQDGSCKKVEGCFLHEWNSDGSCKGCVYGWNDDGTCEKADGCAIEGEWNDDGTCKKVEGCAIADEWNSDGSCKKAEGCAIKGEWNEDGSCKQVEGCVFDGEDKWNEDGSCKHAREDCAFDGEEKWNSDGSCKRIEGCVFDGDEKWNEDGSCKHVREDCAFDGEEKWNRDGSCKRVDGCLNGWNEDGACACSKECDSDKCDDKGACICDITCLADKGSTCNTKTGTCTCSSKCDAGCHENGLCRTPQSCIKENEKECNNYDYCKADNCYCNSENVCTRKDKNMNHMLDQYEDLTRNEKECRKYSDCDSSPNSNDGFCDSFIGYKCSTKCTKNEQCLEGFICREDGRCAADSFTTVWSSNLRNIEAFKNIYTGGITDDRRALRFNATSDDCNVYVCWDWNENGKTIEELIKEYPEIEQTKPSDADYDKYPELKTATCPVPFQHFNSCKEISHDYTVKNEDKVNNKYHILDAKSDIVVKMYGELNGFYVSRDGHFRLTDTEINKNYSTIFSGPSRSSLLEINSFGRVRLTNGDIKDSQNNYYGAFEDCYNLKEVSFVDIPLLFNKDNQQVKIDRMFKNCCSFNHTIENWDVSNVISMEDFLNMHLCEQSTQVEIDNCKDNYDNKDNCANNGNCVCYTQLLEPIRPVFNQPLNKWDVSRVVSMVGMFGCLASFNQSIVDWDVANVEKMDGMFGCDKELSDSSFNQPFYNRAKNKWWNVSKVERMNDMFLKNKHFNQDLKGWNVSNVKKMNNMFRGASSFNRNLSAWSVSGNTDVDRIFEDSGMSCINLNSIYGSSSNWNIKPKICSQMCRLQCGLSSN